MAISEQSIQFFCSKCNTLLKETTSSDRPLNICEECPTCGCQLSETLQIQPKQQTSNKQLCIPFQTAYKINACLDLGIGEIDSFLTLRLGDRLCIIGEYTNTFVTRLCVRAFMPINHGGLDTGSIVLIDAGNSSDVYQCVNFARQFGLEIPKILGGIVVSRAFTIHQLAGLMVYELPKAIRQFNTKLVVISDLLRMFIEDPQVSRKEARYLINEILESVRKIDNVILVMSLHGNSPYDNQILPSFGKRIEIIKTKHLNIKLRNCHRSKQIFIPEKELYVASIR